MTQPKMNEYNAVVNSTDTYIWIATQLKERGAVIVAWDCEKAMTHFDILFTYQPVGAGFFQGGVRSTDLFVSIMRKGAFGFEVENIETHPGYYEEKLQTKLGADLDEEFAKLVNNVKRLLLFTK